jgi:hypothetical protein
VSKPTPIDSVVYIRFREPVHLPGIGAEATSWSREKHAKQAELAESPRSGRLRFWGLRTSSHDAVYTEPDDGTEPVLVTPAKTITERTGEWVDVPIVAISYERGKDR